MLFASTISETLIQPVDTCTMLQTTSTVRSAREAKTVPIPSAKSRQWPREIAFSDCSSRAGIRMISTAEKRNVRAFSQ